MKNGKRSSVISTLGLRMPPATLISPTFDQPSHPCDAPPPPRAWKKCQINWRPVLGSRPLMANRRRREKPALTTCGTAGARALKMASIISSPQWFVLIHTGAGGLGLTIRPLGAMTVIGRIEPSFLGTSAGAMYMMAACASDRVLAYELLINPVDWWVYSIGS